MCTMPKVHLPVSHIQQGTDKILCAKVYNLILQTNAEAMHYYNSTQVYMNILN